MQKSERTKPDIMGQAIVSNLLKIRELKKAISQLEVSVNEIRDEIEETVIGIEQYEEVN